LEVHIHTKGEDYKGQKKKHVYELYNKEHAIGIWKRNTTKGGEDNKNN
jgi:hypothetical protein